MRRLAAALLIPAGFVLTACGYFVTPSNNKILPVEDKLAPGTELTVRKGDIFYRRQLGRSLTATLGGTLDVTVDGKSTTLPTGIALEVARNVIIEHGAQPLPGTGRTFCVPADGGRKASAVRFCLFDTDRDEFVDMAFLEGVRRPDLQPVAIKPTPVSIKSDVPLPGESEARLRFAGNLRFDLEMVEEGKRLSYSNGRTVVKKSKLPAEVSIFGASFTVLSYDGQTDEARIRWKSGFPAEEYSITPARAATTIHVYVPR